jgi:acyl-CoA reductase-like NAD-dependent aldehyde dehydrogenase
MKIINPSNEEIIAELKEDTRESVMKKFKSLKNGWRAWSELPVKERIACIVRFNELLEKDKDELAETLTSEMGKPIRESYNELNGARKQA